MTNDAIHRLLDGLEHLLRSAPAEVIEEAASQSSAGSDAAPDAPHDDVWLRQSVRAPMLGGGQQLATGREPSLSVDQLVPHAVEALNDPAVRERAMRMLVRLGDAAVPALLYMMHHDDPEVRIAASWALGQITDRRLAARLRRGAHWTYHELARNHSPDLHARLVDALRFGSRESAVASAVALGRLHERRALPELTEALSDTVPLIRLAAIWALGQIGAAESIPHLADALYDPDHTIAHVAADALSCIDTPEALAEIEAWRAGVADS
jgi:HEAT repeat protein